VRKSLTFFNCSLCHKQQRDAVYDQVWEEHAKQAQMSRKSSTVVVAMLENAKQSSWQENLDNAFEAQEHFMLGSKGRSEPKFLNKIKEHGAEMGKYSRKYTNRIKDQVADMIETQYTTRYAMRSSLDPRIREQVRFVPGE
jgi:ribosomal protein L37AE/L43A